MKKILIIFVLVILCVSLCACNMTLIDTSFSFKCAVLTHADGTEEELEIASWKDFKDGDQIQFTTKDGVTYLTHSNRVVLKSR